MTASQAAHYLGVSVSKLRTLAIPRRICGAKRLYERRDLDEYADSLPYEGSVSTEGPEAQVAQECDEIFVALNIDADRD